MKLDDFFIVHKKQGFEKLVDKAQLYPDYLLGRIPKNIHSTALIEESMPLLLYLSKIPEEASRLYIKTEFKKHFQCKDSSINISGKEVEQIFKRVMKLKEESQEQVDTVPEEINIDKIKKNLGEEKEQTIIHPCQDYKKGRMFYMFKSKDGKYLLTSRKEILTYYKAAQELGFKLEPEGTEVSNFSSKGVIEFIEREGGPDAHRLFVSIVDYLRTYILFQNDQQAAFLALWLMGTYCFKMFRYYPYLWITAPKRSGKSLLMDIMAPLSFNGCSLANITMAALFRDVHANLRTLFIDEAESFTKANRELSGDFISLLNSGFSCSGEIKRLAKDKYGNFIPETFSAYCPKCLGGISQLDPVLEDRVTKITMIRKKKEESIKRYKQSEEIQKLQKDTRDQMYQFVLTHADEIYKRYNEEKLIRGIEHLGNRDLDIWEPIFILANLIDDLSNSKDLITKQMTEFSYKAIESKADDDIVQDELTKTLIVLKNLLKDKEPFFLKPNLRGYRASYVLSYFSKSKEFSFALLQNKLTHMLKQIGIVSTQRRFKDEGRQRVYIFNLDNLRNWIERYQVPQP
ncbi:MAG: DUF3631 domain-containing protein [Candidatus Omnitrophica bacterium]|nr:DUF3631 domain-containing protein [Candidatus Omnitrophota bacterium]